MKILRIFVKKLPGYIMDSFTLTAILALITRKIFGEYHIDSSGIVNEIIESNYYLLLHVPYWAFMEELLLRFLPFFLILVVEYFLLKKLVSNKIIFLTALISSIYFGYLHGDWRAIFVQGVIGLYLCLIFWRYSFRMKNFKYLLVGLLASTGIHTTFNLFVISLEIIKFHLSR